MALGVSRTYLGSILANGRSGLLASSSRLVAGSCLHPGSSPMTRRSASTTASMMKKGPTTAKATAKASHTEAPSPSKKASTRRTSSKSTSNELATAQQVPKRAAQKSKAQDIQATQRAKYAEMSEEEKVQELDRIMALSHLMPTIDIWSQDNPEILGAYKSSYD